MLGGLALRGDVVNEDLLCKRGSHVGTSDRGFLEWGVEEGRNEEEPERSTQQPGKHRTGNWSRKEQQVKECNA